jgi:N-acetylneuraminic acid mutarotase
MKAALLLLFMTCLISCNKRADESLEEPGIMYFFNDADTIGASLTIIGQNFSRYPEKNIIIFNGAESASYFTSIDSPLDSLKVIIPPGTKTGIICLKVYDKMICSDDLLYIVTGHLREMTSIPVGRYTAFSFSINGKGYVGTGTGTEYLSDFWEFDPVTNTWSRKSDFIGGRRRDAFYFVINGKAYVGGGTCTDFFNPGVDFYEYDPLTDSWSGKADCPGSDCSVGLSINGRGYVITGEYSNIVFEYNPEDDKWMRKNDFPGLSRSAASGFVINNKGYIGIGNHGSDPELCDLWEYDVSKDLWTQKATIPHYLGYNAVGFALANKGYFANGNFFTRMIWEYNTSENIWNRKVNFPGESHGYASSFVINDAAYIIGGAGYNDVVDENWRFIP